MEKEQNKQWRYFVNKISSMNTFRWCIAMLRACVFVELLPFRISVMHELVLNSIDDFLAGRYGSLTTKVDIMVHNFAKS